MDLVQQHEGNSGCKVAVVVADAQYGTNENFAACQQQGIRSHMKDLRSTLKQARAKKGIFQQSDFQYDVETETYICPAGERLKRSNSIDRGFYMFFSNPDICAGCSLRTRCTTSKRHVRKLKRHVAHAQIEKARAESLSGWGRRDRRRRQHLMEGSFAAAANHHGFKRARWRRLHNQRIQDYLIATCQNIRIFVRNGRLKPAAAMAATTNQDLPAALLYTPTDRSGKRDCENLVAVSPLFRIVEFLNSISSATCLRRRKTASCCRRSWREHS